jgi:ribose/xylose/arabinose/galactoside ABC-type transport system permease subunit
MIESKASFLRWSALAGWLLAAIAFVVASGGFSVGLLNSWVATSLPYFLMALAAGVIISCGQVDISIGGISSLCGMVIVALVSFYPLENMIGIIAHSVAFVLVISVYYFFSRVASVGASTFLATMGVLLASKGASTLVQSCLQGVGEICRADKTSSSIRSAILPDSMVLGFFSNGLIAFSLFVLVTCGAIFWRFSSRSGLEHIAVGLDMKATRFCKVSVDKVYLKAFMMAGGLIYFATLIRLHGQANGGWSANAGWGDELLAISIAVIGGTRITGGRFDPIGIALATLALYVSRDVITNEFSVPTEVTSILFGLLLVFVLVGEFGAGRVRSGET